MNPMTPEHLDRLRALATIASQATGKSHIIHYFTPGDAETLRAAVEALERVAERDGDGV